MVAAQVAKNPAAAPNITSTDRLGLTIFFAVVLHSLIILGISFAKPEEQKPPEKLPGLEVTLVQTKAEKEPDEADFLAQANQEGGGSAEEANLLTMPVTPTVPTGQVGEVLEFVPETDIAQSKDPTEMELITANDSEEQIATKKASKEMESKRENLTSKQLLKQRKNVARLDAELDISRKVYSKRKKKKFIGPETREHRFASYEEHFRKKVERIGTLNFPDEAARRRLTGNVIVSVTINADGSLQNVEIEKYSKHKILNDAAKRIVKMASPFDHFPADISKEFDQIVIVRTWQFLAGNRLKTKK